MPVLYRVEPADSDPAVELARLLSVVSDKGLKALDVADLERLQALLQAKTYGEKKAQKSRDKLLKQINFALYDKLHPKRLW